VPETSKERWSMAAAAADQELINWVSGVANAAAVAALPTRDSPAA
jgi:hypothetical protein